MSISPASRTIRNDSRREPSARVQSRDNGKLMITESRNGLGWKGPSRASRSKPPATGSDPFRARAAPSPSSLAAVMPPQGSSRLPERWGAEPPYPGVPEMPSPASPAESCDPAAPAPHYSPSRIRVQKQRMPLILPLGTARPQALGSPRPPARPGAARRCRRMRGGLGRAEGGRRPRGPARPPRPERSHARPGPAPGPAHARSRAGHRGLPAALLPMLRGGAAPVL